MATDERQMRDLKRMGFGLGFAAVAAGIVLGYFSISLVAGPQSDPLVVATARLGSLGGGALIATLGLWIVGMGRTTGFLAIQDGRVFVPQLNWWDPSRCLVAPGDVLAIRFDKPALPAPIISSISKRLRRSLSRVELDLLVEPQPLHVVVVTTRGVHPVTREYVRAADMEAVITLVGKTAAD